ncbi:FtsX-like permease family protein [Aerococcus viridans]|uniref:FtsX-like permease family protein n=1 Tax=Aerococcus viridans TaxID=1377 RepID=UPI0021AF35AE|nr:FtsX-like permease family protein [Aerococcus viridans]MCT1798602.1 FtsX-like permease family protein [Aerococcus viridans]
MKKKMLWKDIRKSITKSKGRFFSIMGLMLIGSFALIGLKVTGPDMRATGEHYFDELNVSDITVIGSMGIDDDDVKILDKTSGLADIEYGYLKDVTIDDSHTAIRVFSMGEGISDYELVEGQLPKASNEIAIDANFDDQYKIDDKIDLSEQADASGDTVLKEDTYEIVGFVYSGEILSNLNQGASTAGTGALKGYAIVPESAFDSDVYMLARLRFDDLIDIDPYSDTYTERLQVHKDDLDDALANQPENRLETIKNDYQSEIDDGQKQIDDAKKKLADGQAQLDDAKQQLIDGQAEIEDAQNQLDTKVADATAQINDGANQIANAHATIDDSQAQLDAAKAQLANGQATLDEKWNQLQDGKAKLNQAKKQLNDSQNQLTAARSQLDQGQKAIANGYSQLAEKKAQINSAEAEIAKGKETLNNKQAEYDNKYSEYTKNLNAFEEKQADYEAKASQVANAQNQLDQNNQELANGKANYEKGIQALTEQITSLQNKLDAGDLNEADTADLQAQIADLQEKLDASQSEYESFMNSTYTPGMAKIEASQAELDQQKSALTSAKSQLDAGQEQLNSAKAQLDTANKQLSDGNAALSSNQAKINDGKAQIEAATASLSENEALLQEKEAAYQDGLSKYNAGIQSYNDGLNTYYEGLAQWTAGVETLDKKSAEYQANVDKLAAAKAELADKEAELAQAEDQLATESANAEAQIADAKESLAEGQAEYEDKAAEFAKTKAEAEDEIADKEDELAEAQEMVDNLSLPTYSVNSRREIPGSDGYKIYSTISNIVDSLANIFPIFLYFVAALVTFTTMTRFVDEERTKSGTLKALGYDDQDVIKKFTFYGLTASLSGTILGIILGHTLLPYIVYNAYSASYTLPPIELHFHWAISLVAILLALLAAVLPAYLVAKRELQEQPAQLLLPKAPSAGSKILLERITPIWNRMSFTHKVTARNIFRYKQRMLMTIFGVAGATALLFSGLSVQSSIGEINQRQFGELIHYDMIVAENDYVSDQQNDEIKDTLSSQDIDQFGEVEYQELTTVGGKQNDTQDITLISPENLDEFSDYIQLTERGSDETLNLPDDGVVISERLASLLDAEVGDTITLQDTNGKDREMKVSGITEMYIGHFVFASPQVYESIYGEDYQSNAYLVNLKDDSIKNTENQAAKFIELDGVAGVVQNTTLMNQIDTIVHSLDKIMTVLIVVAGLLGIVILYNLTNINVSERMRELSTIKVLGFFDNEVTLYIYRETIVLTALGILVGFGIGELLHQYIIRIVPPADVMFNPALAATSFIVPAAIIGSITAVLAYIIYKRLQHVDMLEALKSVD